MSGIQHFIAVASGVLLVVMFSAIVLVTFIDMMQGGDEDARS